MKSLLEQIRHEIMPETKKVYVLTGSHGDIYGENWCEASSFFSRWIRRCEITFEWSFLYQDIDFCYHKFGIDTRFARKIHIVNIDVATSEEFRQYLKGDMHVVLAYSYSRNDAALRAFLELRPVTSIVPKGHQKNFSQILIQYMQKLIYSKNFK